MGYDLEREIDAFALCCDTLIWGSNKLINVNLKIIILKG